MASFPSTPRSRRTIIRNRNRIPIIILATFIFFITVLTIAASLPSLSTTTPTTKTPSLTPSKIHHFYISRFKDFIFQGLLTLHSKSLCISTPTSALQELGVKNSIQASTPPFGNISSFDFVFSGNCAIDNTPTPFLYGHSICRVLKHNGVVVIHTKSLTVNDTYCLHSFLRLFNSCRLISVKKIDSMSAFGFNVTEIVLKKHKVRVNNVGNLSVPRFRRELVGKAEPLIKKEPKKPWVTFRKNLKNVKYLTNIVDISFKRRYVYVDVGARGYNSSIGTWFKRIYPKQNRTFVVYAIEADKAFYGEYEGKEDVVLLPYAAWTGNDTLYFKINREPVCKSGERRRGMGRIQTAQSSFDFIGDEDRIRGFDFACWLKNTVSEKDFVVMKMDVEGTEFDLIPKLVQTGAIVLIDELFLECHYNRWQKCCPGKRSPKYKKTYAQCLELLSSLRKNGTLVHQWW